MGINLNNPNDVRGGIDSLSGKIKPFLGLALPLLKKISPKIQEATGYSVDELYSQLGNSAGNQGKHNTSKKSTNLYDKYKNL